MTEPKRRRRAAGLTALLLLLSGPVPLAGQNHPPAPAVQDTLTARRLAALPPELWLADSSLRVVNLYRAEGLILARTAAQPADSTIAQLVRQVYLPYTTFWNGYLGDEAAFREWAARLLAPDHPIHADLPRLLAAGVDRRFTESAEWIQRTTGRRPHGTWYLVYGPGWTDMGGLSDGSMVADFTRMRADSASLADLLPHELTHQVHGTRTGDPGAGTVLDRIVSEGFASYVAWVYAEGRHSPAQALGYSPADWNWAVAHEHELMAAVRGDLDSRQRDAIDRVASRAQRVLPGGPTAAGYFLGFRMVQAYVARRGADSWKEIYDLPVGEVLTRSGYAP